MTTSLLSAQWGISLVLLVSVGLVAVPGCNTGASQRNSSGAMPSKPRAGAADEGVPFDVEANKQLQLQRMLVKSVAVSALGAYVRRHGRDPVNLSELLPFIVVWPSYSGQTPWPILPENASLNTPGAVISNLSSPLANGMSVTDDATLSSQDIFSGFLPSPAEAIEQQHTAISPPTDVALAGQWLTAIAIHAHAYQEDPVTLSDSLDRIGACTNPEYLDRLAAGSFSMAWWRRSDMRQIGITFTDKAADQRWLVYIPLNEERRLHGEMLGFFHHEQYDIDRWLAAAAPWNPEEWRTCEIALSNLLPSEATE
ncbi:MAG: hypothetical protein GEEBNDBF_01967 [bacterium]|nr:hypothetical protein [bacterium]